jgi:hypothetical protein
MTAPHKKQLIAAQVQWLVLVQCSSNDRLRLTAVVIDKTATEAKQIIFNKRKHDLGQICTVCYSIFLFGNIT